MIRGSIKFFIFFIMVATFIAHHEVAKLFKRKEEERLRYYLTSIGKYCRLLIKLLNIQVDLHTIGRSPQSQLLVANHLSYIDVVVLFAYYPSLFVTSKEIHDTFLLGHITRLAGCFFVERRKSKRSPDTVGRELQEMKNKIKAGFDVFLFPEGTSTDGKSLLPFKTPFFQMAIDCQVPVQPIAIKYEEESRKAVAWYGDMTFADHLFKVCCQKSLSLSLTELEPIQPEVETDRVALSLLSHARIYDVVATN